MAFLTQKLSLELVDEPKFKFEYLAHRMLVDRGLIISFLWLSSTRLFALLE